MSRLISRAELARLAGVSRAAITKACAKQLSAARHEDRIDQDHPAVKAYLAARAGGVPGQAARAPTAKPKAAAKRSSSPTRSPKGKPKRKTAPTAESPEPADQGDENIERYAALTLRQLVAKFGTRRAFKDWLEALKKIEDIRKTRLDNEETEGRLISRDLVKTHVFGAIESANTKLLGDSSKTIARRAAALAKSGAPIEEIEKTVCEILSSQLTPVKNTAVRVLRAAS